jgi:hypothetical protein
MKKHLSIVILILLGLLFFAISFFRKTEGEKISDAIFVENCTVDSLNETISEHTTGHFVKLDD